MNKYVVRLSAGAIAMFSALSAHAALDAALQAALDEAKSKSTELGAAVLVVLIAIAAIKFMRRAI